jgi:cysteine synthase
VFHRHYADSACNELPDGCTSVIEGIGRPRVELSFVPSVIDRMIAVGDAESLGAMRAISDRLGRRVGGSTGTNLWACLQLIEEMAAAGQQGSVVTLLCDGGERYAHTYYDDAWLAERRIAWKDAASQAALLF